MATSGSTNFRVNRIQVIDASLRVLGVLRSGDSSNGTQMETDASEALNLMLKAWQNLGIQLWTRKQQTVAFTTGTSNTNFKTPGGGVNVATPLRVVSAYRKDTSSDVEMSSLSRDEYDRLSNKSSNGTPTQFFYDYRDTVGDFYIWPAPSANTNIVVTYHRPFDDMDSDADDLDFPQSWMDAVKWNLAVRLAPEFGRPLTQEIVALATNTLQAAQEAGYEEGSVRIQPSSRMRWR